jgi:ApaG protein
MEQNASMNSHEIRISVRSQYLPEQSDPDNRQFAFAYTVTIRNFGTTPVQLIARHWHITDGDNAVQEVRGLGIVGQQPLLREGEQFEYTSWATLPTPAGTMRGEYFCVTEDAHFFQAPIAEFALVMPRTLH